MFPLYLMCFIPIIIGAYFWSKYKTVVWLEWILGFAVSVTVTAILQIIAICGMTSDYETWSGRVVGTVRYPEWVSRHYVPPRYNSKGRVITPGHYVYTTHPEYFTIYQDDGERISERPIHEEQYHSVTNELGGSIYTQSGVRMNYYSGDENDYLCDNTTGVIIPTTEWHWFENRVRASPSIFSYSRLSEEEESMVFQYPENNNIFESNRLLGEATNSINIRLWDEMNSRLGPTSLVNVIMIGFPENSDSFLSEMQESLWVGGKKNDLVICYGGSEGNRWSHVFGWTERDIVKRNLETIILNNSIDNNIIPIIEQEIRDNYEIKDWSKFDYLTIPIPFWIYPTFLIMQIGTQIIFWYWARNNEINKEENFKSLIRNHYLRNR